jgi:DNA-binding NarL/FixJ family response regulator
MINTNSKLPIRVLMTEKDLLSTKVMTGLLQSTEEINVIGNATDFATINQYLVKSPIDVLLLDANMHLLDVEQFLGLVNKQFPRMKVIIYSYYKDKKSLANLYDLGAAAIIHKDTEIFEVINVIKEVFTGEPSQKTEITPKSLYNTKQLQSKN